MKIGSMVKVISGSEKNEKGSLLRIKKSHVFIKGLNMVNFIEKMSDGSKKTSKKESKIHISNVKLISS
jgi:ribosomal protein L24